MTLGEIFLILKETGLEVAYSHFERAVTPPYICYYVSEEVNFMADNMVFKKITDINIELYTDIKDIDLENRLENILNKNNICYTSEERFIESEDVFLKTYRTGVI